MWVSPWRISIDNPKSNSFHLSVYKSLWCVIWTVMVAGGFCERICGPTKLIVGVEDLPYYIYIVLSPCDAVPQQPFFLCSSLVVITSGCPTSYTLKLNRFYFLIKDKILLWVYYWHRISKVTQGTLIYIAVIHIFITGLFMSTSTYSYLDLSRSVSWLL